MLGVLRATATTTIIEYLGGHKAKDGEGGARDMREHTQNGFSREKTIELPERERAGEGGEVKSQTTSEKR